MLLLALIAGSRAPRWIAFAQSRPSFETASVTLFIGSTWIPATFQDLPDGKLVVTGYPLQNLIAEAWGIPEERIEGRRDWMNSARFSITAQASGNPDKTETRRMLKTLLEDKFKVKVHIETRELAVFVMTVAKGGLKLDPRTNGDGARGFVCLGETCRWDANGIAMPGFTDVLSFVVHAPVIDETGLSGQRFNIKNWEQTRQTLPADIEQRLGLTLTPATRPIDFLILDEVEDLNAN